MREVTGDKGSLCGMAGLYQVGTEIFLIFLVKYFLPGGQADHPHDLPAKANVLPRRQGSSGRKAGL